MEILFRGKRLDNEEWEYGNLVTCGPSGDTYIVSYGGRDDDTFWWEQVAPETVGQFIGLTDKNGIRVFEGDIVLSDRYENHEQSESIVTDIRNMPRDMFGSNLNWNEIIGNVHDKK